MDESFYPLLEQSANPLISNGVFPFSEPVLCTYIDLDMLIDEAGLTRAEDKIVRWLMEGYMMSDIAEYYGTTARHVGILFKSAVEKICAADVHRWMNSGVIINKERSVSFESL